MERNRYYNDFTKQQIIIGYNSMLDELVNLPETHKIITVYNEAWKSYISNEWSYDGATFVREKSNKTIFEVAAFIHDYRNSMGFVGYYIDSELFRVMKILKYKKSDIILRYILTRMTFLNVIRHKYNKSYRNDKPTNLV